MWPRIITPLVVGSAIVGLGAWLFNVADNVDSSTLVFFSMAVLLVGVAVLVRGIIEIFKN